MREYLAGRQGTLLRGAAWVALVLSLLSPLLLTGLTCVGVVSIVMVTHVAFTMLVGEAQKHLLRTGAMGMETANTSVADGDGRPVRFMLLPGLTVPLALIHTPGVVERWSIRLLQWRDHTFEAATEMFKVTCRGLLLGMAMWSVVALNVPAPVMFLVVLVLRPAGRRVATNGVAWPPAVGPALWVVALAPLRKGPDVTCY